jgi:hypothetical protein
VLPVFAQAGKSANAAMQRIANRELNTQVASPLRHAPPGSNK